MIPSSALHTTWKGELYSINGVQVDTQLLPLFGRLNKAPTTKTAKTKLRILLCGVLLQACQLQQQQDKDRERRYQD
jgi:hypothetical protein